MMRSVALFLLVGLVAGSSLDDTFLQEHGHRFLSSQVYQKGDDFQVVDYAELVRTIGFCVRNFHETGISDASFCLGKIWMEKKATIQLLKQSLKDGTTITVDISDDARLKVEAWKGLSWESNGTVAIDGASVPFTRQGMLRFNTKRITLEEMAQIDGADAALYLDIDLLIKNIDDQLSIASDVSLHYGSSSETKLEDGSVVENTRNGQVNLETWTRVIKGNGTWTVATQGMLAATRLAKMEIIDADGKPSGLAVATQSDALDAQEDLKLDFSSSGIKVTGELDLSYASHLYSINPTTRNSGTGYIVRSLDISLGLGKFNVDAHDAVELHTEVSDYDDNLQMTVQTQGELDAQLGVDFGSDKPVDVTSTSKGSFKNVNTWVQGDVVTVTVDNTENGHVTAMVNGDGTGTGHADVHIVITVDTAATK